MLAAVLAAVLGRGRLQSEAAWTFPPLEHRGEHLPLPEASLNRSQTRPILYRIRTKERRLLIISRAHGWLQPGDGVEVTELLELGVYLLQIFVALRAASEWAKGGAEVYGQLHKLVVASLWAPAGVDKPGDERGTAAMCRCTTRETEP